MPAVPIAFGIAPVDERLHERVRPQDDVRLIRARQDLLDFPVLPAGVRAVGGDRRAGARQLDDLDPRHLPDDVRIGFSRLDPDPHESKRREQVHRELIAAFRRRDPEIAARAVLAHLAANEQTALKALDEDLS
jgi:hypothetical protein